MPLPILLAMVLLQDPPKLQPPPPAKKTLPSEDKTLDKAADKTGQRLKDEDENAEEVKEYTLDPAKAKHEIDAGNVYMHRGSFNAAAKRYEEATRWQPNNVEAFRKLGQALEKKDDPYRAAQAYRKVLELTPGKQDKELRKKIEKLEKEAEK